MNRKALIGGIVLAVVAGVALGWYFWRWRNGNGVLRLPGVVEIQEVRLGSKVGGRVGDVKVREGEEVNEGEELVVFDVPELQAQYEQQQARVAATEADADKVHNGARQQEIDAAWGAALSAFQVWQKAENGFRPEEIHQARDD